jgi:hypothetical protein
MAIIQKRIRASGTTTYVVPLNKITREYIQKWVNRLTAVGTPPLAPTGCARAARLRRISLREPSRISRRSIASLRPESRRTQRLPPCGTNDGCPTQRAVSTSDTEPLNCTPDPARPA